MELDKSKIKQVDLKSLNGKVLQMVVVENNGAVLVAGKDTSTGEIYVISYQDKLPVRRTFRK
jgi:hypothetical protein